MMIKVQDLRVGNKLEKGGILVTIDARSIFDIWNESNEYEPIPLTEKILLKAGFVKQEKKQFGGLKYVYRKAIIGQELTFVSEWFEINEKFGLMYSLGISHVSYLHSLQNLFYALTGTELNIEL